MAGKEVGFVVTDEYRVWIENIKQKIKQSQIKASVKVNYAMLDLYWDIGKDIVEKQKNAKWGDAFLSTMSKDLKKAFPGDIISALRINAKAYQKRCFMCKKQWIMGGAEPYWSTK